MELTLNMSLDNAEAADSDPRIAAASYLVDVSQALQAGRSDGNIRDGDGVTIGAWQITE